MAEHLIELEAAKNDLLACAAYIAENIKSAEGHAGSLKEIVPRYLERGEVDLAAELANTVDDPFTRDRLLVRVAEKCAAMNDDEYAFQLVEAIEEHSTQDEAREQIAAQKSAGGDFAKAFEIAETLPHADYVFAEIAVRQASGGDETNALNTVGKIDFPNAKATAWQNLALLKLEKDDFAGAAELLDKAVVSADEIELAEEKIRTLLDIGNHFLEAKQSGKAVETFDKAKTLAESLDNTHRDLFLGSTALGFLQAGSLELADRTLDLVTDNVQMSSTLVGFAREFWEKDERSDALETLEEGYAILKSQRDRDIRDSRARFGLWAAIAVEFARFEKPERAIEIAQEIPEENSHTSALAQIAQVCAMQDRNDFARQAVNVIADDGQKMFALIGISDLKNKSGNTDEAVNFLREAETYAESVEQLSLRSNAFNELARRFHDYGDAEKTRHLIFENLDTIFNIRDESNRALSLAQMSDFYHSSELELTNSEREMMIRIIGKSGA